MQTEKIKLQNRFHGTSVTIQPDSYFREYQDDCVEFYLSASQLRKVQRNLCGMTDCKCGTIDDPQVVDHFLGNSGQWAKDDWRNGWVRVYSPAN